MVNGYLGKNPGMLFPGANMFYRRFWMEPVLSEAFPSITPSLVGLLTLTYPHLDHYIYIFDTSIYIT